MNDRILTAIKPTGQLTLGNYIGMLKNLKEIQNKKCQCFFFIANLHALTKPIKKEELQKNSIDIAIFYLAVGLDLKKSILFLQSDVSAHSELSTILQNYFYIGELKRMTQFKSEAKKNKNNYLGLFLYPVLMVADILLYDANIIPVGEDQIQHVELTRDLANRFNNIYKKNVFVIPNYTVNKTGKRIMNLLEPKQKMSKSNVNGDIFLKDKPDVIYRKIMSAVTDSGKEIKYDVVNKPGISNLLQIYASLKGIDIKECEERFKNYCYYEFKKEVANIVVSEISALQKKYHQILKSKIINKILKDGAEKANKIANKKLKKIKKIIGLELS